MVLRFQDAESGPGDRLGCSPASEPLQQDAREQADAPARRCFPWVKTVFASTGTAEQLQCYIHIYILL